MENIIANMVAFGIVALAWLAVAMLAGGIAAVVYSHLQDVKGKKAPRQWVLTGAARKGQL
jgi:hypothetical protein